jgi:hypothetical protein
MQFVTPYTNTSRHIFNNILLPTFRSSYTFCSFCHHQNFIFIPLLTYACYVSCPLHPSRLAHCNCTWRRVQFVNLVITHLLPTSRHLIPLRSSSLFSSTFRLYSSLNISDQISRPYKSGQIIVLYILIFIF